MKEIKFSHKYNKLMNYELEPVESARLLEVLKVELSKLSSVFIKYDTIFFDDYEDFYSFPNRGSYLLLIFEKHDDPASNLFTTLRPATFHKEQYYRESIGEVFKVVIEDLS